MVLFYPQVMIVVLKFGKYGIHLLNIIVDNKIMNPTKNIIGKFLLLI